MEILVKQGVSGDCMIIVSWWPDEGGSEIGTRVLWPAIAEIGMPPKSFAMFPDSAVLFPPPGKAARQFQRMLDALKKHPTTSGFPVNVWSPPSLWNIIMQAEEG